MSLLGELIVRIRADADPLKRGMDQARMSVQQGAGQMGNAFKGLRQEIMALAPALSAVAFADFVKGAFDAADQLDDFRKRTGFAVESLSALKTPLLIADSNLEEFSASIARMNNLVGEAASGINEMAVRAFDDLGLSVEKLRQLSPEQQFYEISRALGGITNQADFTNKGMAIFGRSFVRIAPLIRDANGEVEGFVENAKALGNVITQDQVDRIGELNDRWTVFLADTKKGMLELLPLVETLANVPAYLRAALIEIPQQAGRGVANYARTGSVRDPQQYGPPIPAEMLKGEQYGPVYRPPSARGSNAGLIKDKDASAKQALQDFNRELERQSIILKQAPREQAALEAGYKAMDLAQKAGVKLTQEQIEAYKSLARTNYDLAESMKESARFQQELHDKLSATLTDVVFKAGSAREAMLGFAESIARAAFEKRVAGPLADSLIGSGGNAGLLDGAISSLGGLFGGFFADGGRPPVGVPSIVGERGPEVFVPNTAGTVVPNHKIGGQTVIVQQTIQVNPGVPELINAKIREAAPVISAQAQAGVFAALEKGGSESQIARLRT